MQVTASAPGKLMLFGEHAVVYDRPCLVTAVDLRVRVTVQQVDSQAVEIRPNRAAAGQGFHVPVAQLTGLAPEVLVRQYDRQIAFVLAAVARFFSVQPAARQIPAGLLMTTDGPELSYGLGSSSAVTVATVAALAALFGQALTKMELFRLAHLAVLDVQGKGSGFDLAAAIYGGTLYFKTAGPVCEPLPVDTLPIVIGYSGEKVGTVSLVDSVAGLYARQPDVVGAMFDLIEQLVDDARETLLAADWFRLGDLMNLSQGLLEGLGVNTHQLAAPIFAARQAGAYGAKLSGAGGGDCMFALVDAAHRPAVEAAITAAGAQVLALAHNVPGVRIERG